MLTFLGILIVVLGVAAVVFLFAPDILYPVGLMLFVAGVVHEVFHG